jgi:lysophospholipase L1-like esterase
VRDQDVKLLMEAMNGDLEAAASQSQATFIGAPLRESWQAADFVDNGHFSAAGAEKFARSLLAPIRELCGE